jgi:predicted transcriptional regulator
VGVVTERRADGELEAQVLEVLWAGGSAATPGEVLDALDGSLAYTTVMTVLTRLWQKGLVARAKSGRAFAYQAQLTREEFFAERMRRTLAASSDHRAVLSRFVDGLSASDTAELRKIMSAPKK